jgi:hypothetical protein
MTGKNASGDATIIALHFCQSTGQMEETDYDSNTDTWSAPVPASGIGPLNQVGQQPFSMAAFGSGTYPIYWTVFDLPQSGCPGNFIFDYRWDGRGGTQSPWAVRLQAAPISRPPAP